MNNKPKLALWVDTGITPPFAYFVPENRDSHLSARGL